MGKRSLVVLAKRSPYLLNQQESGTRPTALTGHDLETATGLRWPEYMEKYGSK